VFALSKPNKKLKCFDLIYNSPFSNCEQTDSENLPIDWNSVLEDLVELPSADPDYFTSLRHTDKEFKSSDEAAGR
jgi:hypothetical protein